MTNHINFHGGCHGCQAQIKLGRKYCVGCQYFDTEWNKPNLYMKKSNSSESTVMTIELLPGQKLIVKSILND